MGKGKGHFKSDILKLNRDVSHMPFKKGPQHEKDSLADQISQKIVENIVQSPQYDVDFVSKTFGQIRLKELRDPDYTIQEIRGFFSALDFVGTVFVEVENAKTPYIDNDCLFTIKLGMQKHSLPVSLFRACLSQDIRNQFKNNGSFYKIYKSLFAAYERKLVTVE